MKWPVALMCVVLAACAAEPAADTTSPLTTTTTVAPTIEAYGTTEPPCDDTEPNNPLVVPYASMDGVDPNLLSVDIYTVARSCEGRPVVFWIHGGGWAVGDKGNSISNKVALAARHDWVLVSVNYRLSTPDSGVLWPDHGNDVTAAITFVLDNGERYGIDPQRVAVMGHSAGGHLAAMTAVDPDAHRSSIHCLVALDTEGYDLFAKTGGASETALITNAFGSDPVVWQSASPTRVVATSAEPVATTLVISRGNERRRAIALDFADALTAVGGDVTVVFADGYSHANVNEAVGKLEDTVVNAPVEAFLEGCLA